VNNPILKGIFFSIAGFALFSMGDATAKLISRDYSVFQIAWVFCLAGLPILGAASPWLGGLRRSLITPNWKLQLFRGILNVANGPIIFYAFSVLTMAQVYTIAFCTPMVTSLLSIPLLKEHVGWHRWAAIIAGFSGILISFRPGAIPLEPAALCAFLSTILFSTINITARILREKETPLSFSLYPVFLGCFLLAPFALPLPAGMPFGDLMLFIFGGACVSGALLFLAAAFRFAPASVAAPFHYTQMIWGLLLGYFIFGDKPDLWMLAGAAVIIASGLYLINRENMAGKPVEIIAAE
jgi:drug/metabolite transporter (DMT)-like permease